MVHSKRSLTSKQEEALEEMKENTDYVCGQSIFPEGLDLHDIVVVPIITCSTDVSVLYYSAKVSSGSRDLCYRCGSDNITEIPVKLLEEFRSVHPIYIACKGQGAEFRKRLPCKRKK